MNVESNICYPHLTATMILSGSAVQMNGFAAVLQLSRKRLMAVWRSATGRRTPRLKSSTALSQERKVDTKWKRLGRARSSAGMVRRMTGQEPAPPPRRDDGRGVAVLLGFLGGRPITRRITGAAVLSSGETPDSGKADPR